jgi:hypothetical protein
MTMVALDRGRWLGSEPSGEAVGNPDPRPKGIAHMTAATAALATSAAAPRLAGQTAASVVVAFSAMVIGVAVAPVLVLAVAVFVLVSLGMMEVGRSVDRTFQTLTEIGR